MPHFSTAPQNSSVTTLWEWNETDLSQFGEVYRDTGADGVLSVTTNTVEPYQPQIKFTTSGGSAARDYVFYRLLDSSGNPVVMPKRMRMSCRLGYRTNQIVPLPCAWYVDENHRIALQDQNTGAGRLSISICNGGVVDSYAYDDGTSLKTNFADSGDYVFIDLDMRKPSAGVDPGGVVKWGGDFGDDVKSRQLSTGSYTIYNGATAPSTSWDSGWNGEVYAGIGFLSLSSTAGDSFISQLSITVGIGF